MKKFFKQKKTKVLLILLLLSTIMMLVSFLFRDIFNKNFTLLEYIIFPVQKISNSFVDYFNKIFKISTNNKITQNYKLDLEKENDNLKQQLVDYYNIKTENEQLKEMLELRYENPKFEFYKSSIISKDPISKFGDVKIKGGRLDGIKERSPVIKGKYLVGVITEVYDNYSNMSTILNPEVNISGYEIRTRTNGIVSGDIELYIKNQLKIDYIEKNTEIIKGDIVVTSVNSELFPKDLIIGLVDKIVEDSKSGSLYAIINPIKNIKDLTDVIILKNF